MLLRYYVAADLWFCEVSETNGSYVLAFHLSQACSRPHRTLQYDEGPLVRARISTKIQASLIVQTQSWKNTTSITAKPQLPRIKNQMKPAVGSKNLVRGLDENDEDWDAARLQSTAGGRGGK